MSVYIKANGNCIVYDKNITLGDVLKVECTNIGMLRAIKQMNLYSFDHEHSVVFSVLKVIERIHEDYPNVEVINCGAPDFVVEYQKSTVKSPVLEKLKLWLVAVIVFFGSAFTIMTFHIDIGIYYAILCCAVAILGHLQTVNSLDFSSRASSCSLLKPSGCFYNVFNTFRYWRKKDVYAKIFI